jgi:hypothetical protein
LGNLNKHTGGKQMEKKNCIRKEKKIRDPKHKGIIMSIRINRAMSDFMKEQNLAPSLIFYEALKELGFKE